MWTGAVPRSRFRVPRTLSLPRRRPTHSAGADARRSCPHIRLHGNLPGERECDLAAVPRAFRRLARRRRRVRERANIKKQFEHTTRRDDRELRGDRNGTARRTVRVLPRGPGGVPRLPRRLTLPRRREDTSCAPSYSDSARDRWRSAISSDPDSFCDNLLAHPAGLDTRDRSLSATHASSSTKGGQRTPTKPLRSAPPQGSPLQCSPTPSHFRTAAAQTRRDWQVQSYDITERLYFDSSRRVGDAARELLPEPLLAHVHFNAPGHRS